VQSPFPKSLCVDFHILLVSEQVKEKAVEISKAMESEDGVQGACDAFHKHIRKRIPEIMHVEPPPPSPPPPTPPRKNKGEKFSNFCASCWTCQKSEPNK
jgi:hypothetical protein